jgi:hypothetical protein
VCQPSVCGLGNLAGNTVVLQVPSNPITHQSQGGYYNPLPESGEQDRTVHYNFDSQRFSMNSSYVIETQSFNDGTSLTTLKTTVKSNMVTFSPVDFKDGEMKLTPVIDETTGATLYAYHYLHTDPLATPTVETITFDSPKTKEEVTAAVQENNLNLINSWLTLWFFGMLDDWFIPTP